MLGRPAVQSRVVGDIEGVSLAACQNKMKLLADQTTLVLAGAWNPAILNPTWIGRHILGLPAGQVFQVGMVLPVQGLSGPARLSFEGISITPAPDALLFHLNPDDNGMVSKSLEVARRILEILPHTPILAMGINFTYEVGTPAEGELAKTTAWADHVSDLVVDDPDAKVVSRNWQLGISAMGHLINISLQSNAQSTTIVANHHYEVEGSAARAAAILSSPELFAKLLSTTTHLVEGLIRGEVT